MTHEELYEKFLSRNEVTWANMFGAKGLFINGNCFVAFMNKKSLLLLRLDEEGQKLALQNKDAEYFDPEKKGKPMKSWITIPYDSVDKSTERVIEAALHFASSLPGKIRK